MGHSSKVKYEGALLILEAYIGWYEAKIEKWGDPPEKTTALSVADQFMHRIVEVARDNPEMTPPDETIH